MIDWTKPIEYRWQIQPDKWCPATVVFTARGNACKLLVVHVGNSDFPKWATAEGDVRNKQAMHVKYIHLYRNGEWFMYAESKHGCGCLGCSSDKVDVDYECRRIEWEA